MQLIEKVGIATVVIIIIALAAFLFKGNASSKSNINATQAEQFVLSDLYQSAPYANFTLLNISKTTNSSWYITVSATYNASTPCPTYLVESFNYPSENLAPVVNNIYASDCTVHELINNATSGINIPALAIATATTQARSGEDTALYNYLSTYTYNATHAHATFFRTNPFPSIFDQYGNDIWVVNYTASKSNYSLYVALSGAGNLRGESAYNRTSLVK